MRAEDLLQYTRESPFRSFRIVMNSGRTYDVRHPETIRVGRTTALIFSLSDEGVFDRYETISLILIERVEHLETATIPPQQGNGQPPTN